MPQEARSDEEVVELLHLQRSGRMVTVSELLEEVEKADLTFGRRALTYYVSEGLVPRSLRIGARAGKYPESVVDLVIFLVSSRAAGFSLETLRNAKELWVVLQRAKASNRLDLRQVQAVARAAETPEEQLLFAELLHQELSPPPEDQPEQKVQIDQVIDLSGEMRTIDQAQGLELPIGRLDAEGDVDLFRLLHFNRPFVDAAALIIVGGEPRAGFVVHNAELR